jgi:hypothetical protein
MAQNRPQERTEALRLLLRVCLLPISDENRDGDWTPAGGRVNSVSPVPARIALQGGETRGRRSDCEQILRNARETCFVPALRKTRAKFGTCLAGSLRLTQANPAAGWRASCPTTLLRLTHAKRGLLAKPFQQYQETGAGSMKSPRPMIFGEVSLKRTGRKIADPGPHA